MKNRGRGNTDPKKKIKPHTQNIPLKNSFGVLSSEGEIEDDNSNQQQPQELHGLPLPGHGSDQLQSSQHSVSEATMEERIIAIEKSIDQRKLLVAVGRGKTDEMECLLSKTLDVNFRDENGNTPLHYAVESRSLKVVTQLLKKKEVDVIAENYKNIIPLEIARPKEDEGIIDVLVEKIIVHSLEVLKESSHLDEPRFESTHTASTPVDQKIKQIEDKIESCLKSLKKINSNKRNRNRKNISYEQANILIYFIETFALVGDPDTKNEVKKYFSQYYTELDRDVFNEVRKQLLKTHKRKLRPNDVRKFINGNVKSFFEKLEDYVQYVQHVKVLMRVLKGTAFELRRLGNEEDVKSFLIENIKKCEELPENFKTKMKENRMFDFIAQFYPAFQKTVKKFGNEDVDSFFIELQEYAQYVQPVGELESPLLKKDEKSENLLMDAYTNIKNSNSKSDITQEKVFDFVLNDLKKKYLQSGHHEEILKSLLKELKTGDDTKMVSFSKEKTKASLICNPVDEPTQVLKKLREYMQRTQQEHFFLKKLMDENHSTGELCNESYVIDELKKLVGISYTDEKITPEILFNFVVNFYPAFHKVITVIRFEGLNNLRNNLIHDFHKYGAIEFRKEISRLKHTFFKYEYARQVIEVLCAIKPDENFKIITETFENKLEQFKVTYKDVIEKEYVVSTDEAADFFGYKFSQLSFPAEAGNSQTLVDQYLQFMVIIDCDNAKYCAGNEQDTSVDDEQYTSIDDEQDENLESRKELTALARREIFEEFGRLREIHQRSNGESKDYDPEKEKLKNKLKEYGVQSDRFDKICISYEKNERGSCSEDSKKISSIIKSLKKIMNDNKLSSRVVLLLYDQFLEDTENLRLLRKGINYQDIATRFKELPPDEIMCIPIGEEQLSISRRKVVSNMLNTFYNTYHTYAIEFNIDEIFNDETFLDFLVDNETEDIDVKELVDRYFFIFMIRADRKENSELFLDRELKNEARERDRDMFHKFNRLKTLKKYVKDTVYNREKQKFKEELVGSDAVKGNRFEEVWKLCANYDPNVKQERVKVEGIISDVKYMLTCLKKSNNSNTKMASAYQKLVENVAEGEEELNERDQNYLKCEKFYRDKLFGKQVNIALGDTTVSIRTETVVSSVLETFKETVQLKRNKVHHNRKMIKKLLSVDNYTAPYIVRLITRVKSDEMIKKDDVVSLVKYLLKKEEGLYIKPLNELLKMNSTKLNLFEEVCNKISEPKFSIDTMRLIFKETQHLKEIFDVLIERIELEDQSYDEMVKLAIKVLEILNEFDRRLTFPKLEDALKIYNHGLKLIDVIRLPKKPNSDRPIENNESNDSMTAVKYNILLKKAIVIYQQGEVLEKKQSLDQAKEKNQQGKESEKKQSPEVIKKYEEALKIFLEIANTVPPQSLIALSREAHTRFLLKQYYQAHKKWSELYKKIVSLVRHSDESTASYTEEIYTEIENSDEYKQVRVSSGENSEYLDILTIRNGMARALLFHYSHKMDENREKVPRNHKKTVKNCKKALKIYKEVYSYTKRDERIKHQGNYLTVRSMRYMAYAHVKVSRSINKLKEYHPNAVKHTEYALIQNVRILKIQREWYGDYHPAVKKTMGFILSNLTFIGIQTEFLGDEEKVGKRQQLLYQMAQKILTEIPEYIKCYRDKSDVFCSKIETALTSVNEKLDNLAGGRPSHGGMQSSTTLD